MNARAIRSAIGAGCLVMVLVTPADAFTYGELIGMSVDDGDGQAAAVPWFRNTFVKLRAAGTHPVELPDRAPSKRPSAKAAPAPSPELQPPEAVSNLRRADGR